MVTYRNVSGKTLSLSFIKPHTIVNGKGGEKSVNSITVRNSDIVSFKEDNIKEEPIIKRYNQIKFFVEAQYELKTTKKIVKSDKGASKNAIIDDISSSDSDNLKETDKKNIKKKEMS